MSNTPIQVTTDLSKILDRIEQNLSDFRKETNQKLDNLQKKAIDLKLVQVRLEADVSTLKEDVKELKTTSKSVLGDVADLKGAKSLVIPIVVAVITSLLTLLIRIIPNP